MYRSALIAVDFSQSSRPMLERLDYLPRLGVERVVLAHVKPTADRKSKSAQRSTAELKQELSEHAELLPDGIEVETRLLSGDPTSQLMTVAADDGIDLLITGSRAHHPARQLLIGSTAAGIVRKATLPVLLEDVRDADEGVTSLPRRNGPVMLATDGSEAAEEAERVALAIHHNDKPLRVTTVNPNTDMQRGWTRLERVTKAAEEKGVRLIRSVDLGRPEQVIPQIAAAESISLIITGRRGRDGVRGARLGSTAEEICRNANRPVLLVPGKEQA